MRYLFFVILILHVFLAFPQSQNRSYVKTEKYKDALGNRKTTSIVYCDGIGRPIETATDGMNTSGKSVHTLQIYDMQGRNIEDWLPAVGSSSLEYLSPKEVQAHAIQTYADDKPFCITEYDALDRKISEQGSGQAWHTADRNVTTVYVTNADKEIKRYKAPLGDSNELVKDGYYPAGVLFGESYKDENNHTKIIFKDYQGRIILERSIADVNIDTYYVYNDFDELRFVLSPMYQEEENTNGLDKYCYEYRYDRMMRCIYKKLPGCEPIFNWYDDADRLVCTQDGLLRSKGRYRFMLYDELGRLAVQGTTDKRIDTCFVKLSFTGNDSFYNTGYSCIPSISISSIELEYVNYYDDYNFLNISAFKNYKYKAQMTKKNHQNAKGLLTGSLIATSEPSNQYRVTYYNDNGLAEESYVSYPDDIMLNTHTDYSYVDNPTKITYTLYHSDTIDSLSLFHRYSDKNEALLSTRISYNSSNKHLVDSCEYDLLGRKSAKFLPANAGHITYSYNIRNWIKNIDGNNFSEELFYNDGISSPLYNGNISSIKWKDNSKGSTRGYKFTYDTLDRLTNAIYGEGNSLMDNVDKYSEKGIEYNMNGSVKSLKRYGLCNNRSFGVIDDLTITLNGNRISTVEDNAEALVYEGSFDFKQINNQKYTYNGNGALLKDPNKMADDIEYDNLGWPTKITLSQVNNSYIYSGDGEKLRVITRMNAGTMMPVLFENSANMSAIQTGDILRKTSYCGPFILEHDSLSMFLFDGGYISFTNNLPTYHYYLQDHLGNNRAVVNEQGVVEQRTNYYPFGGVYGNENYHSELQPYKYNGKEFDRMHGLDWYDYDARMYDASLLTWCGIDPLAEKNQNMTPYHFCHDNPINRIDPDGKADYFSTNGNFIKATEDKDPNIYIMSKGTPVLLSNYNFDNLPENLQKQYKQDVRKLLSPFDISL